MGESIKQFAKFIAFFVPFGICYIAYSNYTLHRCESNLREADIAFQKGKCDLAKNHYEKAIDCDITKKRAIDGMVKCENECKRKSSDKPIGTTSLAPTTTRNPRPKKTTKPEPLSTPKPPKNMVFVKGGTFMMGCIDGDESCGSDEKPVHEVVLDDFYIGKYEVTNEEYCAFLNAKGKHKDWLDLEDEDCKIEYKNGEYRAKSAYEKHPVVEVTWFGANAYAQWKDMRLPTEAEWEYAARSRGKNEIWAGTSNEISLYLYANYGRKKGGTTAVDSFQPNALGLYDMSGNVWEWCADWYDAEYYKKSPRKNPMGPSSGTRRVLRGGGWGNRPIVCRTSNRLNDYPGFSFNFNGFRLAHSSK